VSALTVLLACAVMCAQAIVGEFQGAVAHEPEAEFRNMLFAKNVVINNVAPEKQEPASLVNLSSNVRGNFSHRIGSWWLRKGIIAFDYHITDTVYTGKYCFDTWNHTHLYRDSQKKYA
jgi:hypothetical protein